MWSALGHPTSRQWLQHLPLLGPLLETYIQDYVREALLLIPWLEKRPELLMEGLLYHGVTCLLAYCGGVSTPTNTKKSLQLNLLCMTVDHLLDDPRTQDQTKVTLSLALQDLTAPVAGYLAPVIQLLRDLCRDCPALLPVAIKAYQAEVASMAQSETVSSETIRQLEWTKAIATYQMMGLAMGMTVPPAFGPLIQLCDDLLDLQLDRKAGITTMATLAVDAGAENEYQAEIQALADELPATYWPFKVLVGTYLDLPAREVSFRQDLTHFIQTLLRGR